jgi:hypothetical protein
MAKSLMQYSSRRSKREAKSQDGRIADFLAERAGMVQRMEYEPLGRLIQIRTQAGWIEFRRNQGPSIGRLTDGSIELLDPWPVLKDHVEATQELCPECLAPCDECFSKPTPILVAGVNVTVEPGRRLCMTCGGAKEVKTAEKPCSCVERLGAFDPACTECRGGGSLPVMTACARCQGEGQTTCPECQGTAQMSTGHLNGAPATRSGAVCPACEGYGKKLNRTVQNLELHMLHDPADYLGPITAFLIKPIGEQREPEPWSCSADGDGRYLYLVSQDNFAPGTRAAFLGGIAIPQPANTL